MNCAAQKSNVLRENNVCVLQPYIDKCKVSLFVCLGEIGCGNHCTFSYSCKKYALGFL